jgi:hypothetical protein
MALSSRAKPTVRGTHVRIDIHCHVVGRYCKLEEIEKEGVYFNPDDNQTLPAQLVTRVLYAIVDAQIRGLSGKSAKGELTSDQYLDLVSRLLQESTEMDGVVLLALDASYDDKGILDCQRTDLWVKNQYLAQAIASLNRKLTAAGSSKRFFFGASVNPNNRGWMDELKAALDHHPALLKWIPSTQRIKVQDVPAEFYQALAAANLPLLCHTGPEYSFPEGSAFRNKGYDDVRWLNTPLSHGVTVIAAHCATPVFPGFDDNQMEPLLALMRDANSNGRAPRLWGDTSAFSLGTRMPIINDIKKKMPPKWLVHGTDYPIPIDAWPCFPILNRAISAKVFREIVKTRNPFDRDVKIKRAIGFDDSILTNAEKVLKLAW